LHRQPLGLERVRLDLALAAGTDRRHARGDLLAVRAVPAPVSVKSEAAKAKGKNRKPSSHHFQTVWALCRAMRPVGNASSNARRITVNALYRFRVTCERSAALFKDSRSP
jgi:hypothetical protein